MKKALRFFGLFVFLGLALASCSSDDGGSSTGNNDNLYDKWWYSADNSTADIYFHADGHYEQHMVLLGIDLTSEGSWEWVDENAKILRCYDVTNNGASEWLIKFPTIGAHSLSLKMSLNDGQTWTDPASNYVDENN